MTRRQSIFPFIACAGILCGGPYRLAYGAGDDPLTDDALTSLREDLAALELAWNQLSDGFVCEGRSSVSWHLRSESDSKSPNGGRKLVKLDPPKSSLANFKAMVIGDDFYLELKQEGAPSTRRFQVRQSHISELDESGSAKIIQRRTSLQTGATLTFPVFVPSHLLDQHIRPFDSVGEVIRGTSDGSGKWFIAADPDTKVIEVIRPAGNLGSSLTVRYTLKRSKPRIWLPTELLTFPSGFPERVLRDVTIEWGAFGIGNSSTPVPVKFVRRDYFYDSTSGAVMLNAEEKFEVAAESLKLKASSPADENWSLVRQPLPRSERTVRYDLPDTEAGMSPRIYLLGFVISLSVLTILLGFRKWTNRREV